jgi:hypothetical protein
MLICGHVTACEGENSIASNPQKVGLLSDTAVRNTRDLLFHDQSPLTRENYDIKAQN